MNIFEKKAQIYGRDSSRKLTNYQMKINNAAVDLALENASLLESRQLLLEAARKRVNETGYIYKKGKSRYKQIHPTTPETPKRAKTTDNFHLKQISDLEDDIKDFTDRL